MLSIFMITSRRRKKKGYFLFIYLFKFDIAARATAVGWPCLKSNVTNSQPKHKKLKSMEFWTL